MNKTPPWSRTRCTHPMSTVLRPPSMPESSPQVWVRLRSPSASMRTLEGTGAGTVVDGTAVASAGGRGGSGASSCFFPLVIRASPAPSSARDRAPQRLLHCLLEIGLAHAPLLAAPEILDRRLTALGLVLTQDHGDARAQLVRLLELRAQASLLVVEVHGPALAQAEREAHSVTAQSRAAREIDRQRLGRGRAPFFLQSEQRALDAHRESDRGHRRASQFVEQSVVASAAAHRRLRAELAVVHLVRRARVVVEAAHEAGIDLVAHPRRGDTALHRFEVRAARIAQEVEHGRQALHDLAARRHLAVEHAQGIAIETLLAIRAQLGAPRRQDLAQLLLIGRTA